MENKEKKTYVTPETEIILFGEDIIATSGPYDPAIIPDPKNLLPGLSSK